METQSETTQYVYIDKFQFVSAKKHLALKGPIHFETVHDRMYPLIKYGQQVKVEKRRERLLLGDILAVWEDECLYFGLFIKLEDGMVDLFFTKDQKTKSFPETYILGQVTNIKIPLREKLKLKFNRLFKRS